MNVRIALVSCVKSKRSTAARAEDLYTSALFLALRQYAESNSDTWYILSAEHGLLNPKQVVAPYERTLNHMSRADRDVWAAKVRSQLEEVLPADTEVILLAGMRYREELEAYLRGRGYKVTVPLEGLSFGRQLQRLNELNSGAMTVPEIRSAAGSPSELTPTCRAPAVRATTERELGVAHEDIERFYDILDRLRAKSKQGKSLSEYTGRDAWPERGVYFFMEPGEMRADHPSAHRIVRVGTHAVSANSKSRLWGRLRAHRGGRGGSGNHRGSIFRLHVGAALLRRDGNGADFTRWGEGQTESREVRAGEAEHERRVSEYIGRMSIVWVAVPDEAGPESDRAYIERNAIGLLANGLHPIDPPSLSWLGRFSVRADIQASGLWNLNHVRYVYDRRFLQTLDEYVERM